MRELAPIAFIAAAGAAGETELHSQEFSTMMHVSLGGLAPALEGKVGSAGPQEGGGAHGHGHAP